MPEKKRIVCFGPGPQFKGGLANYNTSLAKAFDKMGNIETHIVSWTQQYPAIVPREFIDKKSKTDFLSGTDIRTHYVTNYNNPLSWKETVNLIDDLKPDLVIFQWSIALQGLPLSRIAKGLKKKGIPYIFDLHFVQQKEHSNIDKFFSKSAFKEVDNFVVHAHKIADELKEMQADRVFDVQENPGAFTADKNKVLKLYHPVYDLFQPLPDFDVEKFKQENNIKENVFLFFGFIRKYKGLHNVIKAFHQLTQMRDDVTLMICGESFWNTLDSKKLGTKVKETLFGLAKTVFLKKQDDERDYNPLALVKELGLEDSVYLDNDFIPNENVAKYFQVSDSVVLFYEYATPSGVESIAYNFKKPILATKVGHFPETVQDGYNGYLAEAEDINSMCAAMNKSIENPIPGSHIEETTKEMSWDNYARAILEVFVPKFRSKALNTDS